MSEVTQTQKIKNEKRRERKQISGTTNIFLCPYSNNLITFPQLGHAQRNIKPSVFPSYLWCIFTVSACFIIKAGWFFFSFSLQLQTEEENKAPWGHQWRSASWESNNLQLLWYWYQNKHNLLYTDLDVMKYLSLRRRRYIEYEEKRKVEEGTEDENSGRADPPHPALRLMVHVRPCFDSFITRPAPSPQVGDLVCSKSCVSGVFLQQSAASSLQRSRLFGGRMDV